jgi:hypothetical protein
MISVGLVCPATGEAQPGSGQQVLDAIDKDILRQQKNFSLKQDLSERADVLVDAMTGEEFILFKGLALNEVPDSVPYTNAELIRLLSASYLPALPFSGPLYLIDTTGFFIEKKAMRATTWLKLIVPAFNDVDSSLTPSLILNKWKWNDTRTSLWLSFEVTGDSLNYYTYIFKWNKGVISDIKIQIVPKMQCKG